MAGEDFKLGHYPVPDRRSQTVQGGIIPSHALDLVRGPGHSSWVIPRAKAAAKIPLIATLTSPYEFVEAHYGLLNGTQTLAIENVTGP
jgi:hypothetical protein